MTARARRVNRGLLLFLLACVWFPVTAQAAADLPTRALVREFFIDSAGNDTLSLPTDVAVGSDGRIYVVDGGHHRLAIYDKNGRFLKTVGRRGNRPGQFNGPLGIGTDRQGQVYVADKNNARLQVFDQDGRYLNGFRLTDGKTAVRPADVAVSPDGNTIYVTSNNLHKVLAYTPQGKLRAQWGGQGVNKGEFRFPATVDVDATGRVYVVDVLNTRVQVFGPVGKYLLTFGTWGVLPGQLVRPKGVAIGRGGQIFVSDSYMDVVQVFNDAHHFMSVLGAGGKPHRFESAAGITTDGGSRILVAEPLKHRVSVYRVK